MLNKKISHYIAAFWVTLVVALGLIIGGFFCPPMGEVDGSVLTAVGEIFLWPTLAFACKAVEEGKTARFSKGDMNLTIADKEEKGEEQCPTE